MLQRGHGNQINFCPALKNHGHLPNGAINMSLSVKRHIKNVKRLTAMHLGHKEISVVIKREGGLSVNYYAPISMETS